jgi:hypothetical protein
MPTVIFNISFEKPNPRDLDPEPPAVPAARYAHLDDEAGNPGGIMQGEIDPADIRTLGQFQVGDEVFVQGDAADVLDDDEPDATRIWWRGRVIESAG